MKVIKRDGRAVEYDKHKIEIAINKANIEVKEKDRATQIEINKIIEYIEEQDKRRILVEDIQDIIEQKLMEFNRYNLAKKYIVYRYTRALVRKQNTTDETILSLIRNETKNFTDETQNRMTASVQRDYIAGEISCDLTRRILLPQKIINAEENNILHFHNYDYFIQPIINTSIINLQDMLENGTVINNTKVEKPKTFFKACEITAEIILDVANNQYGLQKINLDCLTEYVNDITEIELGIQLLSSMLKSIITVNGKKAKCLFGITLDDRDKQYEIKEIIFNKIKENNLNIVNVKDDDFTIGTFDQGKVTLNVAQIALISKSREHFFAELKSRLDIVKDALMYKHYALVGTIADVSPILWQNGGISRLKSGEKIDKFLSGTSSTLTFAYIGLNEAEEHIGRDNKEEFRKEFNNIINTNLNKWKNETNITFIINNNNLEKQCINFLDTDKNIYGIVKGITDKEKYTC